MSTFSVIIVEDDLLVQKQIRYVIMQTKLFYVEKKCYASVEDTIAALKNRPVKVDFVFLDVELDGMLGTDGVSKLRPYVRFIILCSKYRKKYAEEGHDARPDAFFKKPLLQEDIHELLRDLQQRETWRPKDPISILVRRPHDKGIEEEKDDDKEHAGHPVRELTRVALDDIVRVKRKVKEEKREGNEIDFYGLDPTGHYYLLGSMRTSLKAFYQDYERLNIFLFVTSSVMYHKDYVKDISLSAVKLKNGVKVDVNRSRRSYIEKFIASEKSP